MKVYVGDNNDTVALFSTREKAEDEKIKRTNYGNHYIEEYELDPNTFEGEKL
jgi:hypothetical protein